MKLFMVAYRPSTHMHKIFPDKQRGMLLESEYQNYKIKEYYINPIVFVK